MTQYTGECIQLESVLPSSTVFLKMYEKDIPLRPIESSRGSVIYGVSKGLARILQSLVSKSQHHIKYTQDFVEEVKDIILGIGECITPMMLKYSSLQSQLMWPLI